MINGFDSTQSVASTNGNDPPVISDQRVTAPGDRILSEDQQLNSPATVLSNSFERRPFTRNRRTRTKTDRPKFHSTHVLGEDSDKNLTVNNQGLVRVEMFKPEDVRAPKEESDIGTMKLESQLDGSGTVGGGRST